MRTQLQSFGGEDPIWRFVAQLAAERFTGAAHIGHDPRLRLFAVDGRVYFAERDGDAAVGTRLVNFGVITATQLERGQVHIGDVVSLARMFHRDPSIDRDAVELTIEMATERLLESMATRPVVDVELYPLRHHPAGLHLWARAVPAAVYEPPLATGDEADEPLPGAAPPVDTPAEATIHVAPMTPMVVEPVIVAPVMVEPVTVEPVVVEPVVHIDEPVEPSPVALTEPEPESEPEPMPTLSLSSLAPLAASEPEHLPVAAPLAEVAVAEAPVDEVPVLTGMQALQALQALDGGSAPDDVHPTLEVAATLTEPESATPHASTMPNPMPAMTAMPTLGSFVADEPPASATPTPSTTHLLGSLLASGNHEPDPLDALAQFDHLDKASDDVAPTTSSTVTPYELHSFEPNIDPAVAPSLPTLAAAPTSVAEIKAHQASVADAGSGWGATHNMAAVEIWEMVDDMLAEPKQDENLVSAGGGERKGRGWLRGRKG